MRSDTSVLLEFLVKLTDTNMKHMFDVFILDSKEEQTCYEEAVWTGFFDRNCSFLNDGNRTFLRTKEYRLLLPQTSLHKLQQDTDGRSSKVTIVVDNTEFPTGGAFVY